MSELTYNDLIERFKSSSLEIVPSMPKVLDLDSLEDYFTIWPVGKSRVGIGLSTPITAGKSCT